MFVDQDGTAWITASDGIYTTSGGALTKVFTNRENWTLSGVAVMSVMDTLTLFVSTSDETGHTGTLFSNQGASDVSEFTIVTTPISGSIVCLTTDGSQLYYIDSANILYSHDSLPGGEETLGTMQGSVNNMCYMNGLYVNTDADGIYSVDLVTLDITPIANSSIGPVAVDSAGNLYGASAGLFEYNVTTSSWDQVDTAAIETVGISIYNAGFCIDATGNVYTMTFSASDPTFITLTGTATTTTQTPNVTPTTTTTTQPPTTQPPTTQPPTTERPSAPLIISANAWASVTNVVLAIDTTVDKSYVFEGISSAHHIDVVSGVLSFTNPYATTVLQVGSTIRLYDATTIYTFTVADLNLTLTNLTTSPLNPTARHKAVLANQLLWVLSPAALSVFDGNTLNRVITFGNVTAISFALDISNSVLYLTTSTGLYTSSYPAGNQFTINVADLTLATLNGNEINYATVDMAISADTLYLANPYGNVSGFPLSAINGTGTFTNYAVRSEGGDPLIPLALTFANNSVYVSANTSTSGTLIKLSANLQTVIERKNFPPNANKIMLNRASIVYAAIGNQLWANDYVHLNDVPGANGTHDPVTSNTEAVALASNVNFAVNDTSLVQQNYVVESNGNIYLINSVLQDVMGIGLVQVYPSTTEPPPSVTLNSGSTVADILTLLGSNSASVVLAAALSAGVPYATILLAFAERAATNGTAIFSSYAGTVLVGASVTISAANASALYTKLGITGAAATKNIFISVPNAGVLTLGPTDINTSLAIDDTVTATYSFAGYANHTLTIAPGVQTFTSSAGSTVLSQGSTITLTNGSGSVTYPVLSLDLTVGAGTDSGPVCFLGDAPVKTPHGSRRMDSLKVGDRVSTPTGSAVIQHIHCQDYAAGPSANPYVIPKGRFGATQDLLISPRHKVAVNGRMVEARDLGLNQKDMGTLTYYNLGLGGANMIVAGVLVESLAPMARMTISRAEFNMILAAKYGGRMTPEIAAACHFDGDRVSVPFRR